VKVLVDENLSPALARALNALFAGEHQVVHLRDHFGASVGDAEWIDALSREGRWAIISGDRRITRNRVEYHAFRNSRLVSFFLSRGLYKARATKPMERILALWETIERQMELVEGGAMFELPIRSNRLQQLRLAG
jgi:hypothetical protein